MQSRTKVCKRKPTKKQVLSVAMLTGEGQRVGRDRGRMGARESELMAACCFCLSFFCVVSQHFNSLSDDKDVDDDCGAHTRTHTHTHLIACV